MTKEEFRYLGILIGNTVILSFLTIYILHNYRTKEEVIQKIQQPDIRELYVGNYTTDISTTATNHESGLLTRKVVTSEVAVRVAGKLGHTIDAERKIHEFPAKLQEVCETVFRSASLEDLHDLDLKNIKQTLKIKLANALDSDHIDEVILSKYRIYNKAVVVE